jgi:hypothetical protein
MLCPIVQIAAPAMFHTGHDLALGGTVALELVRDGPPGNVLAVLAQPAEEFLGRVLVPPPVGSCGLVDVKRRWQARLASSGRVG